MSNNSKIRLNLFTEFSVLLLDYVKNFYYHKYPSNIIVTSDFELDIYPIKQVVMHITGYDYGWSITKKLEMLQQDINQFIHHYRCKKKQNVIDKIIGHQNVPLYYFEILNQAITNSIENVFNEKDILEVRGVEPVKHVKCLLTFMDNEISALEEKYNEQLKKAETQFNDKNNELKKKGCHEAHKISKRINNKIKDIAKQELIIRNSV